MFYCLRQHFYRPSMSVDAYNVVKNCTFCARERINIRQHATELSLFPAIEPLAYISIDILGTPGESNNGIIASLVIVVRISKLTETVPL